MLSAVVVNRADAERLDEIIAVRHRGRRRARAGRRAGAGVGDPGGPFLVAPSVQGVHAGAGRAPRARGGRLLDREVLGIVVAACRWRTCCRGSWRRRWSWSRATATEVLLAVLLAHASGTFPSLAAIVLNGGFALPEPIERLLDGLGLALPIVAHRPRHLRDHAAVITRRSTPRRDVAAEARTRLALFEEHVDAAGCSTRFDLHASAVVTPLMFEYGLLRRARGASAHIVLPEGDDDRVLRAAGIVLRAGRRGADDPRRRGPGPRPRARARHRPRPGARIVLARRSRARARSPRSTPGCARTRASPSSRPRDTVTDVSYFGTLMVHLGLADGMVSGAAHTTAHTIRPAFEIIKTRPASRSCRACS